VNAVEQICPNLSNKKKKQRT